MLEASGERPDYERTDVNPRLLLGLALAAAVFLGATPYVLLAIYPVARQEPLPAQPPLPPAPRLQADPRGDLKALRDAQDARLSSAGWIDRTAGLVHVPIERAMTLIAGRGLPDWPKP
jgi:hypothetical protein